MGYLSDSGRIAPSAAANIALAALSRKMRDSGAKHTSKAGRRKAGFRMATPVLPARSALNKSPQSGRPREKATLSERHEVKPYKALPQATPEAQAHWKL